MNPSAKNLRRSSTVGEVLLGQKLGVVREEKKSFQTRPSEGTLILTDTRLVFIPRSAVQLYLQRRTGTETSGYPLQLPKIAYSLVPPFVGYPKVYDAREIPPAGGEKIERYEVDSFNIDSLTGISGKMSSLAMQSQLSFELLSDGVIQSSFSFSQVATEGSLRRNLNHWASALLGIKSGELSERIEAARKRRESFESSLKEEGDDHKEKRRILYILGDLQAKTVTTIAIEYLGIFHEEVDTSAIIEACKHLVEEGLLSHTRIQAGKRHAIYKRLPPLGPQYDLSS